MPIIFLSIERLNPLSYNFMIFFKVSSSPLVMKRITLSLQAGLWSCLFRTEEASNWRKDVSWCQLIKSYSCPINSNSIDSITHKQIDKTISTNMQGERNWMIPPSHPIFTPDVNFLSSHNREGFIFCVKYLECPVTY